MRPMLDMVEEAGLRSRPDGEIRVRTAGTWVGVGLGVLVVIAGFVWTIL